MALFTLDNGGMPPVEDLLDEVFLPVFLSLALSRKVLNDQIFQSIQKDVLELIDIHLNLNICRISIVIFEGIEEIFIHVMIGLVESKVQESFLELEHQILSFNQFSLPLCRKNPVTEFLNVEELLQDRVHVANRVGVPQPNELVGDFGQISLRIPVAVFFHPERILHFFDEKQVIVAEVGVRSDRL